MTDALDTQTERALASVLDHLIPPRPDIDLPGAGGLAIAAPLAERLGETLPAIAQTLRELDAQSAERGVAAFGALEAPEGTALLGEFAERDAGFLPGLIFHAYILYYQQPRVIEALGLEARPPYPKGYELEQGDLGLLDPVRERPRLYREV